MVDYETIPSDGTPRERPQRLSAQQRRELIIDAARREFARVGYHGASTSSIASLAGCSEPMLYKHFSGKHALFLAALRETIGHYQAWFDATIGASDHADARATAIALIKDQMAEPKFLDLLRLRMLAVSLADDEQVRTTLVELDQATRRRIAALVRSAIEQGQVREGVDPDFVAWSWVGFMLAACYREALEPGTFEDMAPVVSSFIESLAPTPA